MLQENEQNEKSEKRSFDKMYDAKRMVVPCCRSQLSSSPLASAENEKKQKRAKAYTGVQHSFTPAVVLATAACLVEKQKYCSSTW